MRILGHHASRSPRPSSPRYTRMWARQIYSSAARAARNRWSTSGAECSKCSSAILFTCVSAVRYWSQGPGPAAIAAARAPARAFRSFASAYLHLGRLKIAAIRACADIPCTPSTLFLVPCTPCPPATTLCGGWDLEYHPHPLQPFAACRQEERRETGATKCKKIHTGSRGARILDMWGRYRCDSNRGPIRHKCRIGAHPTELCGIIGRLGFKLMSCRITRGAKRTSMIMIRTARMFLSGH
jgi:hypothetical protein